MVAQPRENRGRKAFSCFGIFCWCSVCAVGVSGGGVCARQASSTFHLEEAGRLVLAQPPHHCSAGDRHAGSEPCQGLWQLQLKET